jgi:hypothetical protein
MATADNDLDRFFSGTTGDKLQLMEELFADQGAMLLSLAEITGALALLRSHETALAGQMANMDLGALCGSCAAQPGGGCCSGYMEANSDVILLLMNRLQGIPVARQHEKSGECCFLGARGCTLVIKPMFCLNYNCSHIRNRAAAADMAELERLAGAMLTEQTRLEGLILRAL